MNQKQLVQKKITQLFCIILSFICVSCVSVADHSPIYSYISNGDYITACTELNNLKDMLYTQNDKVLYSLDSGLLSHYAGDYKYSNNRLASAELLIEEYYSKSVSQAAGSFFTNDKVIDYAGEEYEDIYTNLFMALNYIGLRNIEDAFVEIRRFDNKQKALSVKYSDQLNYASEQLVTDGYEYSNPDIQFTNSAFARYVSMLLYRSVGKSDSAEIDRKLLEKAFTMQPQLYPFDVPESIASEISIPNGQARLNILGYTGMSPIKVEQAIRTVSRDGSFYYKLAIPEMVKRGSQVSSIEVEIINDKGTEKIVNLEILESIENIAMDTFKRTQSLIYAKAVLRSIAKATTGSVLENIGENKQKQLSSDVAKIFSLLSVASKITTEVTEQADIRTSQYFPANVYVGGITLNPGTYSVRITYRDRSGNKIAKEFFSNVDVIENSVNIVESLCVK